MTYLLNAFSLLLGLVFDAAAALFVLRLLAEASRADFHNPLSQFVYRYSNPVLAPLRRVLPNWRRLNLAALLVAWLVLLLKQLALAALAGFVPALPGLLVLAVAALVDFVLITWLVLVFGWSLLSMLQPDGYHPLLRFAGALAAPLLRPLRGRLTVGMIDFSPTVVIVALLLARLLVAAPLYDLGARLAG
ncbi:YggT family protein [Fulvimonas soli]|jgi:YggT family protein|uniref:YggT family protein n=1 Tax=Fulvimonas soli TaxID=155197 RepID=A0A316HX64_9GAMM|nr:YggT family protein [Fulvimonas soli]PWK84727.1 YggT family protein [Fulvimonas soli]TNY25870.1 YggT family protein [Fulvimonas soli]